MSHVVSRVVWPPTEQSSCVAMLQGVAVMREQEVHLR